MDLPADLAEENFGELGRVGGKILAT